MRFFPNFAAQRAPRFPQRVFQPGSIVTQRYRAPELLGAAAEPTNVIKTPAGSIMIWPSYAPGRDKQPGVFHIEPWQMPGGGYHQFPMPPGYDVHNIMLRAVSSPTPPVAVTPATPVEITTPVPTEVTPSTPVTTTPEVAPTFTDQLSTWLNGEMISGVPNYWLALAAAGAGVLLLRQPGGRR